MARVIGDYKLESLSVLMDPESDGKQFLAELYKGTIENIMVNTISYRLKNTMLSGDPDAGTLVAKRWANISSQDYGTARTAGKGRNVKGKDVVVFVDKDKEFVEEIENKDIKLMGLGGFLEMMSDKQEIGMEQELDTAFFKVAADEGTKFTAPSGVTKINDIIEKAIVTLATLKTDYIHGIPRNMMEVVVAPDVYSEMRDEIDKMVNTGTNTQLENFGKWHGVTISESINLPEGVKFILMVNGSVAQPVMSNPYSAERIGLSEAFAVSLFFHYGTKAVTPETILVYKAE